MKTQRKEIRGDDKSAGLLHSLARRPKDKTVDDEAQDKLDRLERMARRGLGEENTKDTENQ
jgi:hypothetical protein